MNRYNEMMNTHFRSCVLLAKAYDPYRQRDVQIRMLPGEFNYVGVSDGTDAWVCPTSIDPFGINLNKLINDIRNGAPVPKVDLSVTPRHRIPDAVVAKVQAELAAKGLTPTGRRVIEHVPDFQQLPRRRNVTSST